MERLTRLTETAGCRNITDIFAPFFYADCKGTKYSSKEVIGYGQKNSNVYHLNGIHYGVGAERMQKNRRND